MPCFSQSSMQWIVRRMLTLLTLSNYFADQSSCQPTSHAMNHAWPHHRHRRRFYLMGKHICATSRMKISSNSKHQANASFHRARCNGLSGACLPPATQQLLSRTITVAAYKPRDEPCVAAPPSPNAPLLDGEAYLCSFSHEDLKQK